MTSYRFIVDTILDLKPMMKVCFMIIAHIIRPKNQLVL